MRRALLLMLFVVTPLFGADDSTKDLLSAVHVTDVIRFEVPDKGTVTYRVDDHSNGDLLNGTTATFAAPMKVDLTYRDYNPFKVSITSTEAVSADPNQKAIGDFLDALIALAKGVTKTPTLFIQSTSQPEKIQDTVKRWTEEAHGPAGIRKVRNEAAAIAAGLEAQVVQLNPTSIEAFAAAQNDKELLKTLNGIVKLLDGYLAKTWRGDDLVFRTVASDPANQKAIALTFALQTYAIDASNSVNVTPVGEATRSLIIRRYSRFVPEVGVAAVYNELKYPKYTAEKQADNTFLVSKKKNDANVDAALTLNMLCNCFGSDFLFPGFQLGISKAEDYPGIMAGGVLRFAQPKKVSVAFGRMVTWYKDLDTLEVDKPVASQEALDKDLKRKRSPAAWYFAVQYTF